MSGKATPHRRPGLWGGFALGLSVTLAIVAFQLLPEDGEMRRIVPIEQSLDITETRIAPPIRFTDVTAAAGIRFIHFAGATGQKWYPETIGSGAGFLDYDGDGWPDILLVNGSSLPSVSGQSASGPEPTLHLYRNRGDGTFEDVTARTGMALPIYGMGLAAGDYDNDGDRDVLITGYQRNLFFVNNGDGTFTEATRRVGIRSGTWGSGAAFFDYDRDGRLDLVISNYIEWSRELEQGLDCTYGMPSKDYCPVRYFKGEGLHLYHNQGDGTFEDTTQLAGVGSEGARAFAPYIFDFDEDQWPDIFVANDGTPSLVYRNRGDGKFEEIGVRSGVVLDEGGAAYAGMGIDGSYPKNDAQLCIAIGNFVGEPTTLHCRVRQGGSYHPELYAEVSAWAGIGRPTLRYVTFGLFFVDIDLDSFEDLFMVNGHVIDEARLRNAPRAQPPQLFRNLGNGKFEELRPPEGDGLDTLLVGRAAAYADYDGDGDVDILVSQNQGPARLLRNDTAPRGRFLRVRLQGTASNRDGIGTVVRVYTGDHVRKQMLRTGRGYYSQHEFALTFGLGTATKADAVEIAWPSGRMDVYRDVPADTVLRVVEGSRPLSAPEMEARRQERAASTSDNGISTDVPTALTSQAFLDYTHAGINAYDAAQFSKAAEAFEAAIRLRPLDPLPYRYLADLYWRQGATLQAARTVASLATAVPDAYFLDRLGTSFEEVDLAGLAILFYEEAIRVNPQFPSAHYNLGRLLLKRGDLETGMAEVKEALRLYPEFPVAHETLGLAYTEQGRMDLAMTHIERALQLQPDLASARNHLGRIFMSQGRFESAIKTFQTLIAQQPEIPEVRHNLAVAYARQGRKDLALDEFRKAIDIQPDFHAARLDMAALLLEMRRPHDAIRTLQELSSRTATAGKQAANVDVVDLHYRLSVAYLMAGQAGQAISELETVLTYQPEHVGAHLYLGRIHYESGEFDRAWKHARFAESLGADVSTLITALRSVSVEPQ